MARNVGRRSLNKNKASNRSEFVVSIASTKGGARSILKAKTHRIAAQKGLERKFKVEKRVPIGTDIIVSKTSKDLNAKSDQQFFEVQSKLVRTD